MTTNRPPRGGAAVGHVAELGVIEAGTVLYLRLWCDGPAAQARVWNDFAAALGPDAGRRALRSFEQLCTLCVRHGRRPLMRHQVNCRCVGPDEASFANFVAVACEGDREDAMLIATVFVRADIAMSLLAHAEAFGLALKRMAMNARLDEAPGAQANTLH